MLLIDLYDFQQIKYYIFLIAWPWANCGFALALRLGALDVPSRPLPLGLLA